MKAFLMDKIGPRIMVSLDISLRNMAVLKEPRQIKSMQMYDVLDKHKYGHHALT
jgi:hypothetical protein